MKILITGASGYIGRNLVLSLLEEKIEMHLLLRETSNLGVLQKYNFPTLIYNDESNLKKYLIEHRIEGIIHLAASTNSQDLEKLLISNIVLSTRLLDAASSCGVSWFINTGTFWQHYQNKKYSPVDLYSATKQAFLSIAQYYVETSDINFVTLELNDNFGPNDSRPKIFNLWFDAITNNKKLLMSPGEQLIDLNYIDNITDAYIILINMLINDKDKSLTGRIYSVNSDVVYTLKEVSAIFESIVGAKINIEWGGRLYREREVMIPYNNGQRLPNWEPKVSLEEGIRRTLGL